jgi:hypothetical protein
MMGGEHIAEYISSELDENPTVPRQKVSVTEGGALHLESSDILLKADLGWAVACLHIPSDPPLTGAATVQLHIL